MLHFTQTNRNARKEPKPKQLGSDEAEFYSSFLRSVGFGEFIFVDSLSAYYDYVEQMTEADYATKRRVNCLVWTFDLSTIRMDTRGLKSGDLVCFDGQEDQPTSSWPRVSLCSHNFITISKPVPPKPKDGSKVKFTLFRSNIEDIRK